MAFTLDPTPSLIPLNGSVGITLTMRGGQFDWEGGDITTASIYNGVLNASEPTGPEREVTYLYVYKSGKARLNEGVGNNVITEGGFIQVFDGDITWNNGQKLLPIA